MRWIYFVTAIGLTVIIWQQNNQPMRIKKHILERCGAYFAVNAYQNSRRSTRIRPLFFNRIVNYCVFICKQICSFSSSKDL
jgi:hypothetical protein